MKPSPALVVTIVVGLLVISTLAPSLIALSHALVPLIVVGGVVAIILRLVFFHTRH